ncbi:hypothetical protein B0H14DRAFT_2629889 [Mycena olivaceomarginata]|nr:hypothetical protein B0H14DRAFT_2629889 [Mycena olivaceomarginata]
MHITLDSTFNRLKLEEDSSFHPRRGSEHLRGSETWDFYVVTRGRVPGIYTHCKKGGHLYSGLPSAPTPSTPPRPSIVTDKKPVVALTPSQPRQFRDATPASTSAPATPTGSRKKALYVYSGGKDTTIYADQPTAPHATANAPRVPPSPAPEDEWVDMQVDDEPPADSRPPRKRKWTTIFDIGWQNYRDEYLRVLVTREGLLGEEPFCSCGQAGKLSAWNGTFFDRQDLRQLGLRVQLGHSDNRPCAHAHPGRENFVVIAERLPLRCGRLLSMSTQWLQSHWEQLLSYGWYPATPDNPQECHHYLCPQALPRRQPSREKRPAYHFFNALAKLTDNTGGTTFKCRYQLALRVVRQWRNLRALKRGGMGNDPDRRTAEMQEGELRSNAWRVPSLEFLYCIFLAIDACFRLKRKKISSWLADPSIQDGWAYFTRSVPYGEFVETARRAERAADKSIDEHLHPASPLLNHANTKYAQGYAATGCGMITCGRHEIVCKNGVGDLQAGEKYGNMEYIVVSAWRHLRDLLFFLLSYGHHVPMDEKPTYDASEPIAQARKELTRQEEGLQESPRRRKGRPPAWKEAVDAFEAGRQLITHTSYLTQAPRCETVELELMHEEQERERRSSAALSASDDTLTEYLMLGLEIEGQQRQLAADLLANKNPTSKELTDFVTRHTRVSRQIKKLRLMQRIYSPGALQRLATAADPAEPVESEHAPLFLPSGLSPAQAAAPLSRKLGKLSRHGLMVKKRLQTYKTLHSRRQHQNTRSRSLVDNQQQKIDLAARTYRQARAARLALVYVAGECGWRALEKEDLRLPEDEEEAKRRKQRAMKGKRKEAAQVNEEWEHGGRGRRDNARQRPSGVVEGVRRGEALARGDALLQEEMARCLLTLEWQAARWDERAVSTHYNGRIQYSAAHLQGAIALAARQAAVRRRLARRFVVAGGACRIGLRRHRWGTPGSRDEDEDEEGPVAQAVGPGESSAHAAEHEEGGEEEEEAEGEDAERRRGRNGRASRHSEQLPRAVRRYLAHRTGAFRTASLCSRALPHGKKNS